MEHDEKPLPIDTRLLGALAEKVATLIEIISIHLFLLIVTYPSFLIKYILPSVSSICKGPSL